MDERQKDLDVKKNELDEIISETKQEEEKLRDKAKELETKIEPRLLQSFKRIRKNSRNGLGIVYVQRDACGGCFNKIPPQRQLDIRSRKKNHFVLSDTQESQQVTSATDVPTGEGTSAFSSGRFRHTPARLIQRSMATNLISQR